MGMRKGRRRRRRHGAGTELTHNAPQLRTKLMKGGSKRRCSNSINRVAAMAYCSSFSTHNAVFTLQLLLMLMLHRPPPRLWKQLLQQRLVVVIRAREGARQQSAVAPTPRKQVIARRVAAIGIVTRSVATAQMIVVVVVGMGMRVRENAVSSSSSRRGGGSGSCCRCGKHIQRSLMCCSRSRRRLCCR